ncbi:MAG: hypothetical protein ACI39E_00535 [Acutalibacteraceae bacterium]
MKMPNNRFSKPSRKRSGAFAERAVSLVLSALLLFGLTAPVFAEGMPSEKEEVIYINLTADGSVKEVYAVNIFEGGEITDYGDYSSLEMLNTTDKISYSGEKITFSSSADRVYCKGVMANPAVPWTILIRYFLDGTAYSADEIAGKSGKLKIQLCVAKNEACHGDFFDAYALQASFTLDADSCRNITAPDATVANVGGKKQLSYIMLPGEGIDTFVTADVTDFEMSAVSINGIPLSMNIEIDDKELLDQVTELTDAVRQVDDGAADLQDGVLQLQDAAADGWQSGVNGLNSGAGALSDGVGELYDGAAALTNGTQELKNGSLTLYDGVHSLNDGIGRIQAGLTQLSGRSDELKNGSAAVEEALVTIQKELSAVSASTEQIDRLVSGSFEIKEGIASLAQGITALQSNVSFAAYKAAMQQNGLDIDALQTADDQTIQTLSVQTDDLRKQAEELNGQIAYLEQTGGDPAQIEQLKAYAEQLQASARQLAEIKELLEGNRAAIGGTEVYLTQINGSLAQLAAGVSELQDSYAELDAGICSLAAEMKALLVNLTALKSGVDTLVTEYKKLDDGIGEYTDGVAQVAAGYTELVTGAGSLLAGSRDLKNGTAALSDKTAELYDGVAQLVTATGTLRDGTGELAQGTAELLEGMAQLGDGAAELKDGTAEMRSETEGLDERVSAQIDEMIKSVTGGDIEVTSFVSEKNTNITSVQFVIQTQAVEMAETEAVAPVEKETLTFWQKILRLFGLY